LSRYGAKPLEAEPYTPFFVHLSPFLSPYRPGKKIIFTQNGRKPEGPVAGGPRVAFGLNFGFISFETNCSAPNPSQVLTPHLTQVGLFKERESVKANWFTDLPILTPPPLSLSLSLCFSFPLQMNSHRLQQLPGKTI
jgi:hypothetical protein